VALQIGDLGHPRGGNKPNTRIYFNGPGARFFDALLKDGGRAPRNRSVTAFTLTCPKGAPGGRPLPSPQLRRPDRAPERAPGTAVYERRVRHSFLMLGLPTVRASIRTTGPFGELTIRLCDVAGGRHG
jgi:hypothetical protein